MFQSSSTLPDLGVVVHAERPSCEGPQPTGILRKARKTPATRLPTKGAAEERKNRLPKRRMGSSRPLLGRVALRNHGPPETSSAKIPRTRQGTKTQPCHRRQSNRGQVRQHVQMQFSVFNGLARRPDGVKDDRRPALLDFSRLLLSAVIALGYGKKVRCGI